jgi:hypothetical protein
MSSVFASKVHSDFEKRFSQSHLMFTEKEQDMSKTILHGVNVRQSYLR